ncbi:diguanylate cyclase (GGDEF)-like protein [Mycobacterium sp. MAA66]|uniref:GGDEF domain-containing protein n=1 Tax=Mycobacterium sp. MAA66 TaxID=3156297 RepID=UPI003514139E
MTGESTVWTEVIWCALALTTAATYGLWVIERRHPYLAYIGSASACATLAMAANSLPVAIEYRLAINALLLVGGALLFIEGLTRRAGRRPGRASTLTAAALGVAGVLILAVTHQGLRWEVRLQDATTALVAACGVFHGRMLTNGRRGDRLMGLLLLGGVGYFLARGWFGLDMAELNSGRNSSFAVFTPPFTMFFAGFIVSMVATLAVQEIWGAIDKLRDERDTDVLTGLLNRRGFQTKVELLLEPARYIPSSFVVFDLDDFKSVNDHYGHTAGDELLRRFGALLSEAVGANDVVGRLGGDEFALYLTGPPHDALVVAGRVRESLVRARSGDLLGAESTTTSFGIAAAVPGMKFTDLLAAADHELYHAKRVRSTGR